MRGAKIPLKLAIVKKSSVPLRHTCVMRIAAFAIDIGQPGPVRRYLTLGENKLGLRAWAEGGNP